MFYDNEIVKYFEDKLNEHATNNLVFSGELGFYDADWIKEHLGVKVTPFVLTDLGFNQDISGDYLGRFSLAILAKNKFRQEYIEVINNLFEEIRYDIQNYNGLKMTIGLTGFDVGEAFSSGAGNGEYYFEIMLNMTIRVITSGYSGIERVLKIDSTEIRHKGLKFEHGKMDIANIESTTSGTTDNINKVLNNGVLVVEAYLDTTLVKDLLNVNKIGIKKPINITFADFTLINEEMSYDGYMLSNEQGNSLTVFLYFSLKSYKNFITINGITLPIVSDAINMAVVTEPYRTPNSNVIKNIYIAKTRAYTFVVAETFKTDAQLLLGTLWANLLNNDEKAPLFEVIITLNGQSPITKNLLLNDIQKSSKDGGRGLMTLQFVDGVDI